MTPRNRAPKDAPRIITRTVPISELRPDPRNANTHPRRNLDVIKLSLATFGQVKPLVVTPDLTVHAGSGTLEAAIELGWTHMSVTEFQGTAEEARAYAIADNRASELSIWDERVLAENLDSVGSDLRVAAGFMDDEYAVLNEIVAKLDNAQSDPLGNSGTGSEQPAQRVYDDEAVVSAAIAHYREVGFPYPKMPQHEIMQQVNALAATPDEFLRNTVAAYHVADRFHPQRFAVRCSNKVSPLQAFGDDVKLTHAFRMILAAGGKISDGSLLSVLGFVRGAQMAAQFRPGFALSMLRRFLPDEGVWLDTSAGYGGRLTGYAASHGASYIGIDPSSESVAGNTELAKALGVTSSTTLIQQPAEDVTLNDVGGRASVDLVFTSPPYFAKEKYADEPTQSFKRYPAADQWRSGFLLPMLDLSHKALRTGCYCVINIADVRVGRENVPLVDWTIDSARRVGFTFEDRDDMPMPRVPGQGDKRERTEPTLIFRKGKR
jgi:hypothetical protein